MNYRRLLPALVAMIVLTAGAAVADSNRNIKHVLVLLKAEPVNGK